MSTQIYAAPGTFPLKIRESISTRFSGLLEYSATYLIEKGGSSSGFSVGQTIVTSAGAVNIFPAPRVTRSNDKAFDEVEITAYGKSFQNQTPVYGNETLTLSQSFNYQDPNDSTKTISFTINEEWRSTTATITYAQLNSQFTNYLTSNAFLDKQLINRTIIGPSLFTSLPINWTTGIRNISRVNYGAYDEISVTTGNIANL